MRITMIFSVVFVVGGSITAFAQDTDERTKVVRAALQGPDEGGPKLPAAQAPASDLFAPLPTTSSASPTGMWFDIEYLLWWSKANSSPPLAIQGPQPNGSSTPFNTFVPRGVGGPLPVTFSNYVFQGVTTTTHGPPIPTAPGFIGLYSVNTVTHLGLDNAKGILFPNSANPLTSGARFRLGDWVDNDQTFGVELSYLFLLKAWSTFSIAPGGDVVGIPYRNAVTGEQTSYLVNLPQSFTSLNQVFINTTPGVYVHLFDKLGGDAFAGSLSIRSWTSLQTAEANALMNLGRGSRGSLDAIGGFRFLQLNESMSMESAVAQHHEDRTNFEPALGLPGGNLIVNSFDAIINRVDLFETRNSFYGGQLGLRGTYDFGRFFLSARGAVGLGVMNELVRIDGATSTDLNGVATPTKAIKLAGIPLNIPTGAGPQPISLNQINGGGLFAQPTNIGHYTHNAFAVVPEGILKANYRVTDRLTGSIGYTFLYASSVARPGNQINTAINPSLLTTAPSVTNPPLPAFQLHPSDYWTQGISFGLDYRF